MDILIAVGTRPDYVKLWPVYHACVARGLRPTVLATGQHHDLLLQQQKMLFMPLDHWLLGRQPNLALDQLYGAVYTQACQYLREHRPDVVVVSGDTSSSLAIAQAAFHQEIPIAHIESGLRSGCLWSPYPEEYNRITIDAMATWLCAPTETAAGHCRAINPNGRVAVTGNTVIDALQEGMRQLANLEQEQPRIRRTGYFLLELHRRETVSRDFSAIVKTIVEAARQHRRWVIWPAHPNPAVQKVTHAISDSTLWVWNPQEYLSYIELMRDADLILTDSGGTVEEAITLGTPTLQIRDHTDRPEAIAVQASYLVGTDPQKLADLLNTIVPYAPQWKAQLASIKNPYGDGNAGERAVEWILSNRQ